ncbi:putative SOS response-associated peptidase YedK [Glaciihabitans tibetensis]|uniref:Abasic site processing protein n=2 Tax=Glaciihabitans tibetensis TaxID=1266600 RepID=A0A2T0VIZ9_9MICO|nr:SOS response-associated peptidase [Glaciihabitans tibetensis]PRY70180.1 putative SOS response-associated peptidase YedK [Glaciihabitans tibetensis]
MCGRFVLDRKTSDLVALFDIDVEGAILPGPSWNIAPTQNVRVVIDAVPKGTEASEPVRRLESARWGLVPSFAKDLSGPPLFNARSETVTQKPAFQSAVGTRRAVVPASGYYEWHEVDGVKTPQYISLPDEELFLFAALYEWWRNPAAQSAAELWLLSTTILTRPSTGPLSEIHERMPVFLDAELASEWLDPHADGSIELVELVADAAEDIADQAQFHAVGSEVGTVQNDTPSLIRAAV